MNPAHLYRHPNALASHYSKFRVADRLLLTGHSHQAWPDVGFDGQVRAWEDAAELVDGKWERAFAAARRVREGYARLLDDDPRRIALGANTHELVVRLMSALPLRDRPRIVTTNGEFHTLRRQLDRLAEEGFEIVKVPSRPAGDVSSRLINAVDETTALVAVSCVMYENAHIVDGLGVVADRCADLGVDLLVDAYHALNVVPFTVSANDLESAFIVGGGYKYCQLGEGNAFIRVPDECRHRPVVTGWYAEFGALEAEHDEADVAYGEGGARFAGATYDPTSHYRAAEVFEFFERHGLTSEVLREVSRHQIEVLAGAFDALDLAPELIARDVDTPLERVGGFLALESPYAGEIRAALATRGVSTDHRGDTLRLGPAPYLSDHQLTLAVDALAEVASNMRT